MYNLQLITPYDETGDIIRPVKILTLARVGKLSIFLNYSEKIKDNARDGLDRNLLFLDVWCELCRGYSPDGRLTI